MNRNMAKTFALAAFALAVVLGTRQAQALETKTPYPSMAPLDQYLMTDRNAEIALARSAAPDSISRDAKILVLGRHGYETAVEGKNGFACIVERSWMSPFDHPEFWNPKIRGPLCFNPPAVRCILPLTFKRTELVLAGLSKAQIMESIEAASDKKELPALESGAMTFMMSKRAYLTDKDDHNLCHLMLYTARMDGAAWGADLPGAPVMLGQQLPGAPVTEFLIPVAKWSDGTTAPTDAY